MEIVENGGGGRKWAKNALWVTETGLGARKHVRMVGDGCQISKTRKDTW